MNKKFSALFMVLALIVSIIPMKSAEAHSVLENSTPKEGATLEEPVELIELSFNTKIEKGSTLYVLNQKGEKIEPNSVTVKGNALQASFKESLVSGTYQIKWKILGADGHLIEKQYSFTISTTKEASPNTNNQDNEQKDKEDPETENPGDSTSKQQETDEEKALQQVDSENESNQSPFMYGMIIVILIAGALLLFWMLFSKKRQ